MRNRDELKEREEAFAKISVTKRVEVNFWKNCAMIAFGILLANITCADAISFGNIFSYVGIVVLIWVLNFVLRPFLVLFTLPFIILTFGAGMVFINALVIWIASSFIPGVKFSSYFYALWAAFLIEVVSWSVALFETERVVKKKNKDKDVIDL